jgi:AcrR family transcriptional regulator
MAKLRIAYADSAETRAKPTRQRIVDAAYKAFDRHGVTRATIDDIAGEANLSRATIYKHFDSKTSLLRFITELELEIINKQIRAAVAKYATFEDKLTEALAVSVNIALRNNYTRRVFASIEATSNAVNPEHSSYMGTRESWRHFLEHAQAAGDMDPSLNIDDVVIWLTLALMMMYVRLETTKMTDTEVRSYLRRFVVEPLHAKYRKSEVTGPTGVDAPKRPRAKNNQSAARSKKAPAAATKPPGATSAIEAL